MGRRVRAALIAVYVVLLHVALAWVVWLCDPGFVSRWRENDLQLDRRAFWRADNVLQRIDGLLRRSPVVLFGDSFMEDFPADLAPENSLNLGLGGHAIDELRRTVGRYPSLALASAIVVEAGINDLCRGETDIAVLSARYSELLKSMPANVPIVWLSIPPIDSGTLASACRAKPASVDAANEALAKVCAMASNCRFSNVTTMFAGESSSAPRSEMRAGDGIHLSRRGYETLGARLRAELSGLRAPR
jgi:hypothetical protein